MIPDREWNLHFLGVGVCVPCAGDDPRKLFTDANGEAWKRRHRVRLVQPDNPDLRGEHTVIWRELPAPDPTLGLPAPEPIPELLLELTCITREETPCHRDVLLLAH